GGRRVPNRGSAAADHYSSGYAVVQPYRVEHGGQPSGRGCVTGSRTITSTSTRSTFAVRLRHRVELEHEHVHVHEGRDGVWAGRVGGRDGGGSGCVRYGRCTGAIRAGR